MVDVVVKRGHQGPKLLQTFFLAIHGFKTAAPSVASSLDSGQEGTSKRASQGLAESAFFEKACPSWYLLKSHWSDRCHGATPRCKEVWEMLFPLLGHTNALYLE